MIATLIPFFVACHVAVEEPWDHGPEYVFKLDVASSMVPLNFDGSVMNVTIGADLICRSTSRDEDNNDEEDDDDDDEDDALICRFENGVIGAWGLPNVTNKLDVSSPTEDLLAEPFGVEFNEHGVEYLIVPRDSARYKLNILRSVMNKFTFGVNMRDMPDGSYDLPRTSLEPCTGRLHVTRYPSSIPQERAAKSRTYRLEPLENLGKRPAENLQIVKQRNVGRCAHREPFVFDNIVLIGDTERAGPDARFLNEHLSYSSSMITVTDIDFRSYTKNRGTVSLIRRPEVIEVTEIIGVYLASVRPARGPLPEVPRAGRTSVAYDSRIEDI